MSGSFWDEARYYYFPCCYWENDRTFCSQPSTNFIRKIYNLWVILIIVKWSRWNLEKSMNSKPFMFINFVFLQNYFSDEFVNFLTMIMFHLKKSYPLKITTFKRQALASHCDIHCGAHAWYAAGIFGRCTSVWWQRRRGGGHGTRWYCSWLHGRGNWRGRAGHGCGCVTCWHWAWLKGGRVRRWGRAWVVCWCDCWAWCGRCGRRGWRRSSRSAWRTWTWYRCRRLIMIHQKWKGISVMEGVTDEGEDDGHDVGFSHTKKFIMFRWKCLLIFLTP